MAIRRHPARIRLALLALNRASPKLSRSAPPNGHLAHLRGHGALMGSFKATLSEAGMMASPKAGPLLWRAPRARQGTQATGKSGRRRSTRAVQCPDANGRHAWRPCPVLRWTMARIRSTSSHRGGRALSPWLQSAGQLEGQRRGRLAEVELVAAEAVEGLGQVGA